MRVLAKELLGFREEGLVQGRVLVVAAFAELLDLGFLFGVKLGGDFDSHSYMEIAFAARAEVLDAFSSKTESGAALGAGRDLDRSFAL